MTTAMRPTAVPTVLLPPLMPPAVQKLAEQYLRLDAQRQTKGAELRRLRNTESTVQAQDVAAHAAALRDGKKDPGPTASAQHAAALAAAQREYNALSLAVSQLADDLRRTGVDHAETWRQQARTEGEKAQADYLAAIDALTDARERLVAARDVASLVDRLEDGGTMVYKRRQVGIGSLGNPAVVVAQLRDDAALPIITTRSSYEYVDERPSPAA